MKQILQSLADGQTLLADVPAPATRPGALLIATRRSLVSAGTERMLLAFGKASLVGKARQQPEKVRMVLDKVRSDGLAATYEAVKTRLDEPVALGYCNAGVVVETGAGVSGFRVGDRVVSNGAHAEFVCVPQNLCSKIPADVSDEQASFTVVGAIALQGIRLMQPQLGERVAVIGLGLIGLLAVQLLRAHGCRVLGIDLDPDKCALAETFGAQTLVAGEDVDVQAAASAFSDGIGTDGVLITAAAKDETPIRQAAEMCRKRGRIVLVGVADLQLSRDLFYRKELTFQVSCSYGPGRYDPSYEDGGQDYPVAYVRWSAQRNFEAVLDMLGSDALEVAPLVTHRFPVTDATRAYAELENASPLAIVLEYAAEEQQPQAFQPAERSIVLPGSGARSGEGMDAVGVVGAGNYASRVLIPALSDAGADLRMLVTTTGVSGATIGAKFGFAETTTEPDRLFENPDIRNVVVATRHDSHARFACAALAAGKNVFVEKPLALTHGELDEIEAAHAAAAPGAQLMVGFNRRFAPLIVRMKALLETSAEPPAIVITVNAGEVAAEHWVQDPRAGGGRIVGEACHFIDLARFLVGCPVQRWQVANAGGRTAGKVRCDRATLTLEFDDGALASVHYIASGHRSFPKERVEAFVDGRVLQLDNFRTLRGWGWPNFSRQRSWRQDKGNAACAAAFVEAMRRQRAAPIAFDELLEVSRLTIDIADALP